MYYYLVAWADGWFSVGARILCKDTRSSGGSSTAVILMAPQSQHTAAIQQPSAGTSIAAAVRDASQIGWHHVEILPRSAATTAASS